MKLLVCDKLDSQSIEAMCAAGIEVVAKTGLSPEQLIATVGAYHVLVVRSATKVSAPVIDAATDLKCIIRGGVGLDNIAVDYAKTRGIEVLNTPVATTVSVAELTIGYLFALARRIPQMTMSMKAGKWEKKVFEGEELAGKTLGLVGCGRIGQEVARRATALAMRVIFYDVVPIQVSYARQVPLEELLKDSDYISMHVPLTPQARHMIGKEQFAMMKDPVRIIQCARGGTIDEEALYEAIVSGKVAGAALDVFTDEDHPDSFKGLVLLDQVIASPHVGASTIEAQARVGREVAELAISFYRKRFDTGQLQ